MSRSSLSSAPPRPHSALERVRSCIWIGRIIPPPLRPLLRPLRWRRRRKLKASKAGVVRGGGGVSGVVPEIMRMKDKVPRGVRRTSHMTRTEQRPSMFMTRMRPCRAPKPKPKSHPRAKAAAKSGDLAAGVAAAGAAAALVQAANGAQAIQRPRARPMRTPIKMRCRITILRNIRAAVRTMRVRRMARAHTSGIGARSRNRPSRNSPGASRRQRSQASPALSSARLVARAAPRMTRHRLDADGGAGRRRQGRRSDSDKTAFKRL